MTIDITETIDTQNTTVPASHDSFFKASMQHVEIARDFLKAHLPAEITQQVKFETLRPMPNSFVGDQHRTLMTDMLY